MERGARHDTNLSYYDISSEALQCYNDVARKIQTNWGFYFVEEDIPHD